MEFFDDGSFTVKEGENSGEGTYQLAETKDSMEFTLKDDATGEENTATVYLTIYGDHMAIYEDEADSETTGNIDYYVRSEAKGQYDSEKDFDGLYTVWNPQSGIEKIEIGGESYNANELYVRFQFNVLQICKPEKIGDTTFKILSYAPYEFSNGCRTIEFFANDPFSDAADTSYDVEVSEGTLTFSGDGMKITCKEVELK